MNSGRPRAKTDREAASTLRTGRPHKEAGTLSLMVSIPTVAAGAVTDRRLGRIPNSVLVVAILMGVGSIIGVLIGAALLPYLDRDAIEGLLGVILLLATVRLTAGVEPEPRASGNG